MPTQMEFLAVSPYVLVAKIFPNFENYFECVQLFSELPYH